ncbi:uncharacterized protein IWZ02DRAFT_449251 [Phyllosticta citriasiana]|uniref:uncharacterized protein n=1 Tax=Phyllosticta citriasiana TaxID=595635 RepID=UPI0030FDD869
MIKQASKQASIATCHLCIPPLRSCLLVLSCLVLSCPVPLLHHHQNSRLHVLCSALRACASFLPFPPALNQNSKTLLAAGTGLLSLISAVLSLTCPHRLPLSAPLDIRIDSLQRVRS